MIIVKKTYANVTANVTSTVTSTVTTYDIYSDTLVK